MGPTVKRTARPIDQFAGIQVATREHQARHGCGDDTYQDGTSPGAIAAAAGARRIVAVGTALGYNSCWLATTTSTTEVDTIEFDADDVRLACEQVSSDGLAHRITVHHGDGDDVLASLPAGEFDFAFFDGFTPRQRFV